MPAYVVSRLTIHDREAFERYGALAPQGPPGTPGVAGSGSGNRTAAPAHSNSICSYNGLNDMNPQ